MSVKPVSLTSPPDGYAEWLADLKGRIHTAQQRASLAVNHELVLLYCQIGRDILARQADQGWGSKVIERLAQDLRAAFPDMRGFSPRNLKYMRAFAEAWPDDEIVQAVLAQLPWYHQLALLDKLNDHLHLQGFSFPVSVDQNSQGSADVAIVDVKTTDGILHIGA